MSYVKKPGHSIRPSAPLVSRGSFSSYSTHFNPFDLPEYEAEDGNVHQEEGFMLNWHLLGSLEVNTNRRIESWDDLLEDLDVMLDEYYGSTYYKDVFIIIYYLFGTHLRPHKNNSGKYKTYKIEADTRIAINHKFPHVSQESRDFSWNYKSRSDIRLCSITFKCSLRPTRRLSTPYKSLYEVCSIPGLCTPDLEPILAPYGIKIQKNEFNYLFYKSEDSKLSQM